RIDRINKITQNFHEHIIFKDEVNFNFLFSLYSQKLKELYNSIEKFSDSDFKDRLELLKSSVKNIRPFIIE
ncbi:MAG: hypothetical protein ACTSWL_08375, partial [Promethearchaeota archaeon]